VTACAWLVDDLTLRGALLLPCATLSAEQGHDVMLEHLDVKIQFQSTAQLLHAPVCLIWMSGHKVMGMHIRLNLAALLLMCIGEQQSAAG
jgi:hypothetical protein